MNGWQAETAADGRYGRSMPLPAAVRDDAVRHVALFGDNRT
jgi:hypothetical protein